MQFFSDKKTAIASFRGIDILITTFAVPHAVHANFASIIALAYEMEIPVFELQHGLFQIGFSYSERSAVVGSGMTGALTSLDAPNLVDQKLVWGKSGDASEQSIGYPPYTTEVYDRVARRGGDTSGVLIATNTHWNILTAEEVRAAWEMIIRLMKSLPDIRFTIMPHPAEVGAAPLKRVIERCDREHVMNMTVMRPSSRAEFIELIATSRLAVSMISSVLLDFEMYDLPCVILPCRAQRPLAQALTVATRPSNDDGLLAAVRGGYYEDTPLILRTGKLFPFDHDALKAALDAAVSSPLPAAKATPLISKYLPKE
ncbi:hypothetical protein ASG19_21680 [Rhizobium sp. Leaf306]|nr:hypothetical protein ASG19_21680 [Rhizobium sp. Leaf306]